MGAAHAGSNNNAYTNQSGDYNSAEIDQSAGNGNDAGSNALAIRQVRDGTNAAVGRYNTLSITQSGDNNEIGLANNGNPFGQNGIYQQNTYNAGTTGYNVRNEMTIQQTSSNNKVGAASQVTATHQGTNSLSITQGGLGGHTVGSVSQFRAQTTPNVVAISQTGQSNTVKQVQQFASIYTSNPVADANRIDLVMTGQDNGNDAWSVGGAASASGATSSALIQGQSYAKHSQGGKIDLLISGDRNEYGVYQAGYRNSVGSVTVSGNDNELGIYQDGNDNALSLSTVSGDRNELGVRQIGSTNVVNLTISGDDNGGGTLAGAAGTLALANGLVSGLISQDGGLNTASLTINGNGNQFALLQDGSGNGIVGSVSGAGGNSAAVVQIGDGNTANFTQAGGTNIVAISQ
jgi:hypothetical protein